MLIALGMRRGRLAVVTVIETVLIAMVGAVVGEYLGSAAGLGYRIHQAEGVFDTVGVFSGMLVLTIFVVVIDAGVTLIEKRLLHWRPQEAHTTNAQG